MHGSALIPTVNHHNPLIPLISAEPHKPWSKRSMCGLTMLERSTVTRVSNLCAEKHVIPIEHFDTTLFCLERVILRQMKCFKNELVSLAVLFLLLYQLSSGAPTSDWLPSLSSPPEQARLSRNNSSDTLNLHLFSYQVNSFIRPVCLIETII